MQGIEKRFGGVRALDGADFMIGSAGTIHGLLGENGSGKSTLLRVLSGQLKPESGHVRIDGVQVSFNNPTTAQRHGIAMVAQETALAPHLSVAENILLGRRLARRRLSGIDWAETRRRAAEVLDRLHLDFDPRWPVHKLGPDQQQMVEVARAMSMDARIIILDEPTSSLTDDQVENLFAAIRKVRSQGVATVFVSHRLTEVLSLVDDITVLRDGVTAAHGSVGEFDAHSLVDAMVGQESAWTRSERPVRWAVPRTPLALRVRDLTVPGAVASADVDVNAGQIVGVAGLVGAGRSELLRAIFGLLPAAAGTVTVRGRQLNRANPRQAIAAGVGYLPPDRKVEALALNRSVSENLTMVSSLGRFRFAPPRRAEEMSTVEETSRAVRLNAASPGAPVATLSGGNQQKVALGKLIAAKLPVLLLDEPTRGVDVASKAEIHQLLHELADGGAAILISSSENPELLELSDHIVVMFRGRPIASLAASDADEGLLARCCAGHV